MSSSDPPEFGLLHALLSRDVATDKAEVKRLLHRHQEHLLRTLESTPSADRQGGAPAKQPAFPALAANATPAADPAVHAASTLLQIDERAATQMVQQLKGDAYNDAQALASTTAATPAAGQALLVAELALLRHAHEQRCLLLRCVHQLLCLAYDANAELHTVACGQVALLMEVRAPPPEDPLLPSASLRSASRANPRPRMLRLRCLPSLLRSSTCLPPPQGRLAERIVNLIPTLEKPTSAEVRARLPARLREDVGKAGDSSNAAALWLEEVDKALALHASRERCEALGLLLLLRYMPLHHSSEPETLAPLSDLLDNSAGTPSGELYLMLAGREGSTIAALLGSIGPLLAPRAPAATAALAAWDQRSEQLATLVLMAAMHGEEGSGGGGWGGEEGSGGGGEGGGGEC